jgi:hypothetical protein
MDGGQKRKGLPQHYLKQGGGAGSNTVNNFTKRRITESG